MAAGLADIDAALFGALKNLEASPPIVAAPFALVGRYAGEPTKDGLTEVCAQYPAALLRFDTETGTRDIDTIGPDSEDRMADRWTVIVAVEDPRSIDDAMVGAPGTPGALALIGAVTGACNALFVPGLWRNRSIRQVSVAPIQALIHRGSAYAYAIVFEALRVAEEAADPIVSQQNLNLIHGNVNEQVPPGGDPPTNPFDVFTAATNP
jgi:hypothetical protein